MSSDSNTVPDIVIAAAETSKDAPMGVATAVPAFVGYTERAQSNGQSLRNQPVRITSLAEYTAIFGGRHRAIYQLTQIDLSNSEVPADSATTAESEDATAPTTPPASFDFQVANPETAQQVYYNLSAVAPARFVLFDCMQLFFANGGSECYVVSVGDYTQQGQTPAGVAIDAASLCQGLAVLANQAGPTILIVPDASGLAPDTSATHPWESAQYQSVVRCMLAQCGECQDRVAVLDVYGSQHATADNLDVLTGRFRLDVGDQFLSYGMSYFPLLQAALLSADDFDCLNFQDPSGQLSTVLSWENVRVNGADTAQYSAVQANIGQMTCCTSEPEAAALSRKLAATLPLWAEILELLSHRNNQLPPSSALAGIYAAMDARVGVWNAPANVSLCAVSGPSLMITDAQQADLNLPLDGRAINALREFTGRGTVVWGSRTLDGSDNDLRYIQFRRTLIYIEQSIKNMLSQYVFSANDSNTWNTVTASISAFLMNLWARGGLLGTKASDAFTVQCGLGSTMTTQDILDGYMIVQTTFQLIRPADFITLKFKQLVGHAG